MPPDPCDRATGMQPPETQRLPDPALVEKVLRALDAGMPATVEALAAALGSPTSDVQLALAAAHHYRAALAREQAQSTHPLAADDDELPPGTQLGDFVLDAALGSGAMGVVYRARQVSLRNRPVALKVLPRSLVDRDPRFVQRFRREASLAATIHHPNLAEVYGFEETNGTLCFSMRLVAGPTLHEVLAELARGYPGPVRSTSRDHVLACVQIVRGLADALAAIHARGLVHRDVKPANVILEGTAAGNAPDGSPPATALAARPVLVDFGLLRPAGDTELTGTRTLLGTPAYAAYEAQLGRDLDARADVFSLGAVFHDLLTMTPPGTRGPATAGLPDVRAVNPTVDPRLAAVVGMALQEKKELRYEHGGALRDELDRYLRGEPLRALPQGGLGRLRLWVRRNPVRAARNGVVVFLAAVLVGVGALFGNHVWSLTQLAARAAQMAAAGDLLAAVSAYRQLDEEPTASSLPWLADDLAQAAAFAPGPTAAQSAFQRALGLLESRGRSADAVAEGLSEHDFARACDRLREVLMAGSGPELREPVQRYLVRVVREGSDVARRIAMDRWADLLLAQHHPQVVPHGLEAALRDNLGEPLRAELSSPTRQAAAVAYGSIRSLAVFEQLIDLIADPDVEVALSASICSWHVYRWLHRDQPEVLAHVARATMTKWALAHGGLDERVDARRRQFRSIATNIAWYEHPLVGPSQPHERLDLPERLREIVQQKADELAAEWRRAGGSLDATQGDFKIYAGLEASEYDASIWASDLDQDREVLLATDPARKGAADALRGAVWFEKGPEGAVVARIDGTLFEVAARAAAPSTWEAAARGSFLCCQRPGHSLLRIKSTVPPSASRLQVRILQMKGTRGVLRNEGSVMLRYSLTGLPWEHSAEAPGGNSRGDRASIIPDWNVTTVLDAPVNIFDMQQEIELRIEYLHGNTTHRILRVDFEWESSSPEGPK